MRHQVWPLGLGVLLLTGQVVGASLKPATVRQSDRHQRPARWAQPIKRPGLPNFYRVSMHLYRGGQPTRAGFRELAKLGVKTVVNLRSFHSDRSKLRGSGLAYRHLYVKAWHPEREDVLRFLRIVTHKGNGTA